MSQYQYVSPVPGAVSGASQYVSTASGVVPSGSHYVSTACVKPAPVPTYYAPIAASTPGKSKLRVIHNVAKGKEIDGYLDGTRVLGNFPYKRISEYLEVNSGHRLLEVKLSGTDKEVISGTVNLEPGRSYTLIANGHVADTGTVIQPLLLIDDISCPPSGKSKVRFIHAANNSPAVDIYSGLAKIFENISFGHVGSPEFILIDAGDIGVTATTVGSSTPIFGPIKYRLNNGGVYTIVASGIYKDPQTPLSAIISEDSHGSCIVMNI